MNANRRMSIGMTLYCKRHGLDPDEFFASARWLDGEGEYVETGVEETPPRAGPENGEPRKRGGGAGESINPISDAGEAKEGPVAGEEEAMVGAVVESAPAGVVEKGGRARIIRKVWFTSKKYRRGPKPRKPKRLRRKL